MKNDPASIQDAGDGFIQDRLLLLLTMAEQVERLTQHKRALLVGWSS